MTEIHCELVQDRMPMVAAGRERWSDAEARHLAGCEECTAVQRLLAGAGRLGQGLEAHYDPAPVVARVTARLRTEHAGTSRRLRVLAALAAAAAVTVAVLTWPGRAPVPVGAERIFLTELDSLDTAELAILADQLAPPLADLVPSEGGDLLDLDSTQLERVLRSLEG